MNWTPEQLAERNARIFGAPPVEQAKVKRRRKVTSEAEIQRVCTQGRYRSKTEERYAAHLDLMKRAGEILDWAYEPVTLKLAKGCRYTPDFMIRCEGFSDTVYFEEVKGRNGTGFWSKPVGKVKVKLAAALFPQWRFRVVWPGQRLGEWDSLVIEGK